MRGSGRLLFFRGRLLGSLLGRLLRDLLVTLGGGLVVGLHGRLVRLLLGLCFGLGGGSRGGGRSRRGLGEHGSGEHGGDHGGEQLVHCKSSLRKIRRPVLPGTPEGSPVTGRLTVRLTPALRRNGALRGRS